MDTLFSRKCILPGFNFSPYRFRSAPSRGWGFASVKQGAVCVAFAELYLKSPALVGLIFSWYHSWPFEKSYNLHPGLQTCEFPAYGAPLCDLAARTRLQKFPHKTGTPFCTVKKIIYKNVTKPWNQNIGVCHYLQNYENYKIEILGLTWFFMLLSETLVSVWVFLLIPLHDFKFFSRPSCKKKATSLLCKLMCAHYTLQNLACWQVQIVCMSAMPICIVE